MLPQNINEIIFLNLSDEEMKTREFINYDEVSNLSYYQIKEKGISLDETIEAITPTVLYSIYKCKNMDVFIDECTDKFIQRYGDYNVHFLDEEIPYNDYVELKTGGIVENNHLISYIDVFYMEKNSNKLYYQEKSYNDELGILYHQVANNMLIYFHRIDLFAFITNVQIIFDYLRERIRIDGFKDKINGNYLLGDELKNNVKKANDKHKNKEYQYCDYRIQEDKHKCDLVIRLYLDMIIKRGEFEGVNIEYFKINR